MAAVFCASLSRSAIRLRRRVIRTRSSRGSPSRGPVVTAAGAAGAEAEAAGVPAAAESSQASTSPLVKRPSLPVPGICAGSSLCSSTSLRTDGGSTSAAVTGAGAASAAGAATALTSAAGFAAGSAPAAPSPIRPRTAPTDTSAPESAAISLITPAAVALTSRVTLSVSNSTMGSSTSTLSPTDFSHFATVASVTDSPSWGTTISVAIFFLIRNASALPSGLLDIQRLINERILLLHMAAHLPSRR